MTNMQSKRNALVWVLSILVALTIVICGIYYTTLTRANQMATTVVISSYAKQPDDLLALAQKADLVVEGTIKEVQPAVWTTPDGLAPNDSQFVNNPDIQLRTPFLITVERTRRGHVSGDLLFSMEGGTTTQYRVVQEDSRALAVGDKVIVFLSKAPANAGPWAKISPYYPQYYFVVSGDKLVGSQHNIARQELERQFISLQEDK